MISKLDTGFQLHRITLYHSFKYSMIMLKTSRSLKVKLLLDQNFLTDDSATTITGLFETDAVIDCMLITCCFLFQGRNFSCPEFRRYFRYCRISRVRNFNDSNFFKMAGTLDKYFSDSSIPDNINKSDINSIKDWLSKQRHLPELSDRQIAIFIHSCFGALELTKITIDSYYTIRTHAPELFNGRNANEVAETSKVIWCVRLNQLSPDGCRILLLGLADPDSSKFNLIGYLKSLLSNLDIMYNENSFDEGIRIIYDMTGASFGHLAKFNVTILKKAFTYLQDGLPLRLKGIHIFNAIPLVNQFLAVVRPIMKKELYQLIHVHSTNNIESLYEFVPKDNLPSNFGGKAPSVDELIRISNEKMQKYEQWFVDDEKFGRVDETKRAGKAKNSGDIFGFDGSFKKLDLD